MLPNNIEEQILFLGEIEKLKVIYRQNGIIDKSRQENSAEHSWHISIMALILSQYSKTNELDVLKVIKMLLIHDIVEIDAGDNFLYSNKDKTQIEENENNAAKRIFGLLPLVQQTEYFNLWKEFEARATYESKFARAMDGIQPLLNHLLTTCQNENPHKLTKSMIMEMKAPIKDVSPILWDITLHLIDLSVKKGLYINS